MVYRVGIGYALIKVSNNMGGKDNGNKKMRFI